MLSDFLHPKITSFLQPKVSHTEPDPPIHLSQFSQTNTNGMPDIQVPYSQTTISTNRASSHSQNTTRTAPTGKPVQESPLNKPLPAKQQRTISVPQLHMNQFLPYATSILCPTANTWGHELESIDSTNTLRIILQNPNGIKLNPLDLGDFAFSMQVCRTMGAGIISISESNVNWNQSYLLGQVNKIVRKMWQTTVIQPSQHLEPFHHQCQRGRNLQIATDQWVSRIQSKGVDPYGLGRWSYMIFKGKNDRSVAIITAYRVCKTTFDSAGDTTSYMQQFCSLLSYNNSINCQVTPNPHRQFMLDLQAWITMLRQDNISIILSLDGNENLAEVPH